MTTHDHRDGELHGDRGRQDAAIKDEVRRAHALDAIDHMLRYTSQSTATLERVAEVVRSTCRAECNAAVLDAIALILCDPDWAAGMLEDVAALVRDTGRSVENLPGDEPTWMRH